MIVYLTTHYFYGTFNEGYILSYSSYFSMKTKTKKHVYLLWFPRYSNVCDIWP